MPRRRDDDPNVKQFFPRRGAAGKRPYRSHALCARAYGKIRNDLRLAGNLIGPNDLLIAATAVALQATLVSSNLDEFKRVPGLRLENWYETRL